MDIVEWLHRNRTEGCTEEAMDLAAQGGHFDVVVFLHRNRSEGCSPAASMHAADYGHLEIVQWIKLAYTKKFFTGAVRAAAAVNG